MDLTTKSDWNSEWDELGDVPHKSVEDDKVLYKVYSVLRDFSGSPGGGRGWNICELGGAPGTNLIALSNASDYMVTCIDYSDVGCKLASYAFRKHGLVEGEDWNCYNRDIRADIEMQFDAVYSLGLVEHFEDPSEILTRHFELCREGGLVIIGLPIYIGLRGVYARLFCPDVFNTHNTLLMRKDRLKEYIERNSGGMAGSTTIEIVEGLTKESMWRCTRSGRISRLLHRLVIEVVGLGEYLGVWSVGNEFTASYMIGWTLKG